MCIGVRWGILGVKRLIQGSKVPGRWSWKRVNKNKVVIKPYVNLLLYKLKKNHILKLCNKESLLQKFSLWLDNSASRSHRLLNKNLSARCGIPPLELLAREVTEKDRCFCSYSWLPSRTR